MADMLSILSANYKTVGLQTPSNTPYKAVDPAAYQGTWTGVYANGKKFAVTVTNVTGFRAQVKYDSAGTVKYQQVLIKDNTFRVGDTKFKLSKSGTSAEIKNVVTDPVTQSTYLDTATAKRTA
ncbi:MAG: hypothetical protein HXX15_07745 [Rhodopseudomonas sp.]|uniref:hypothetical protein n=1 Tax=Rhodopseudomonas sp. TaxID=1078 RepID=UPI0017A5CB00|nr:hypothetical protein [Rhodopseudomonas sp.]NVN85970.1 hypothetical protein [Rhodopseudomonas sp.]